MLVWAAEEALVVWLVVGLGGWVVVRLVALLLIVVVMVLEVLLGVGLSQSSTAAIRGSLPLEAAPLLPVFVGEDGAIDIMAGLELGVRTGPVRLIRVDVKLVWWRRRCFLHV